MARGRKPLSAPLLFYFGQELVAAVFFLAVERFLAAAFFVTVFFLVVVFFFDGLLAFFFVAAAGAEAAPCAAGATFFVAFFFAGAFFFGTDFEATAAFSEALAEEGAVLDAFGAAVALREFPRRLSRRRWVRFSRSERTPVSTSSSMRETRDLSFS